MLKGLEGKNLKASNNFLAKSSQKVERAHLWLISEDNPRSRSDTGLQGRGGWVVELA